MVTETSHLVMKTGITPSESAVAGRLGKLNLIGIFLESPPCEWSTVGRKAETREVREVRVHQEKENLKEQGNLR